MAFFPRVPSGDFAPLFRLLDDYDVHRTGHKSSPKSISSFAPKFDVRELKDAYQLDGELPGINQQDVEIEFSDPHTLVIKGRSEREYSNHNLTGAQDQAQIESTQPTKSLKATVEEEEEPEEGTTASSPTPTTEKQASKPAEPKHKFWVSERSVGQFHRTFSFPNRVDQDNVTASLKNGILSIVVPKAAPPTARKITIS